MDYDSRLKLSQHFMVDELTRTDNRDYIDINHREAMNYYNNLVQLCNVVLERVREITGPVTVTSGFRCLDLNRMIGGSTTSQHMVGEAADTVYTKGISLKAVFNELAWSNVPYSQIIFEFGQWIHIGLIDKINYPGKIGQRLIATRNNGATIYNIVRNPLR